MHKIIDPAPSPTSQDWRRYNLRLPRVGQSFINVNDMHFHNLGPSIKGFNHLWEIPPPLPPMYIWGSTDHFCWWSYWCSLLHTDSYLIILFQHDYLYLNTILIPPPYHVNWAPYQEENTIAAPNSNYFTDYSHFVLSDIRLTKGGNIPEMLTKTNLSSSL